MPVQATASLVVSIQVIAIAVLQEMECSSKVLPLVELVDAQMAFQR